MWMASILLLAVCIDLLWGEPPAMVHPVVWMGHYLEFWGKFITLLPPVGAFLAGAAAWCVGALAVATVAWSVTLWAQPQASAEQLLVGGVLTVQLLKSMLSIRMLLSEVRAVETALQQSLPAGRERLSWLVSRDTSQLTEDQVRESAIETLAENLNDSVIAPIFWFVLLGLPGAAVYRFANTADAMWGYKGIYKGRNWEWAGKWAARADDVLSWLPARITAGLLWLVSGFQVSAFWSRLWLEARKTPSPNSGWPMSAMALVVNIQLSKPDVYTLNLSGNAPKASDTQKSIKLASKSVLAVVFIACVAIIFIAV
jgi:adenosylcobinamide-phosphate synthase